MPRSVIPPSEENRQVITMVRWLLYVVFIIIAWVVLRFAANIVGPVLVSFGLAYLMSPVLDALTKRGVPRSVGALGLLIIALGLMVGAVLFVVPRAIHQLSSLFENLPQLLENISGWLHKHFGIELPTSWRDFSGEGVSKHLASVADNAGPIGRIAVAAVGGVVSLLVLLAELLLVPVFAYYFLLDYPQIKRRVVLLIPPRRRVAALDILGEIDGVVSGWVRGQAVVIAILMVLYVIGFSLAGMSAAIPVGLVVGALIIIPFLGAVVGAALSLGICLADGSSSQTIGMVVVVLVVLHLLEATVLTPKIVGHKVGLTESAALFAVFAGGRILGFTGVLLAIPIAATIAVLVRTTVRYYENSEFYGVESDADVPITDAMQMMSPSPIVEPHHGEPPAEK